MTVGKKHNWSEKFGNLDKNLNTSKATAVSWNIDVYPSLRDLYANLDGFSQQYIQSFHKLEPKLRVMKSGRVDQAVIDEELEMMEEMWIDEGLSSRMRRYYKN